MSSGDVEKHNKIVAISFHSFIQQLHGFCQLNTKTVLGTEVENTTMEKIGIFLLFSVHKCSKMMSPGQANEQV